MNIKKAIEEGIIEKIEPDAVLVKKELGESDYDFERACKIFEEQDYKWSIVQSYYSMFHAARAVLFKLGLKERRHVAVNIVLDDLNKKGKLESKYIYQFKAGVSAREDADYHYIYSEESASEIINIAEEFNEEMKKLCKTL
jgi:uncharacterized protein (UPF0332 family)